MQIKTGPTSNVHQPDQLQMDSLIHKLLYSVVIWGWLKGGNPFMICGLEKYPILLLLNTYILLYVC